MIVRIVPPRLLISPTRAHALAGHVQQRRARSSSPPSPRAAQRSPGPQESDSFLDWFNAPKAGARAGSVFAEAGRRTDPAKDELTRERKREERKTQLGLNVPGPKTSPSDWLPFSTPPAPPPTKPTPPIPLTIHTTTDLLAALPDPLTFAAKLALTTQLSVKDVPAFRSAVAQVYATSHTSSETLQLASSLIRTTQGQANASELLYEILLGLTRDLPRLNPRPPPDAYLALFEANRTSLTAHTFRRGAHPLVYLLETCTHLFAQDQRRLDPSAQTPPEAVLEEIERLRGKHREAVRGIHRAMKVVGERAWTRRSMGSLMDGYHHAREFEQVQGVWETASKEGGTGVDGRSVAIYLDACGFAGALPQAFLAWQSLRSSSFPLNENHHAAHQECLCRCGAWNELVSAFKDQHADPRAPRVSASAVAGALKLAERLVRHSRFRTLRAVDGDALVKLKGDLTKVVGGEVWMDAERMIRGNEPFALAAKSAKGSRARR